MIQIEAIHGVQYFTKAVFVWSGHVNSGWPTSFDKITYNDELNGVISYGHDDEDVTELSWFIPNGSVGMYSATMPSRTHATEVFRSMYGDRVVIWMNPKEDSQMLQLWSRSLYVLTPANLELEPFTGSTRQEFREWAHQYFEGISSMTHVMTLSPRV